MQLFYHNGHVRVGAKGHAGLVGGGDWKNKWGYGFEPTLNYHDGHGEVLKPKMASEQWADLGLSDSVIDALVGNEFGITNLLEIDMRALPELLQSCGIPRGAGDRVIHLKQMHEQGYDIGLAGLTWDQGDEIEHFENQVFQMSPATLGYDADSVSIGA